MSDLVDPKNVFSKHLETAIKDHGGHRTRHKYIALGLKMSTSALGGCVTVLLGWQNPEPFATTLKNAALVLSALITVLSAYDAFFEPRKLWVRETLMLNSLNDLQRKWKLEIAAGNVGPDTVKAYSDDFHGILTKSLNDWVDAKRAT